jgi:hypothetical protein
LEWQAQKEFVNHANLPVNLVQDNQRFAHLATLIQHSICFLEINVLIFVHKDFLLIKWIWNALNVLLDVKFVIKRTQIIA